MAEENVAGVLEVNPCAQDMDLVTSEAAPAPNSDDNGVDSSLSKRAREEEPEKLDDDEDGVVLNKKQRVEEEEKSLEEERLEKVAGGEDGQVEEEESGRACLGPKTFGSSVEMFDYFYKFLHYWPPNLDVNAYEQMVLMDLLKKGHPEPDKKVGGGINAFQVRYHPMWKSRCFFLIRGDDTVDDFSFRKCVDHILPLPEEMKLKSEVNKSFGGGGGGGKGHGGRGGGHGGRGGGRGRGRGRGRGGRSRN
ncbi:protein EMBRYO DEFECTIVE 514 [Fagus crenata]